MIYSQLLFIGMLPSTNTVLYTVPAENVVVVRDIELVNGGSSSSSGSLNLNVSGATATLWLPPNLAEYAWAQWHGRVVVPAGGEILGNSNSGDVQAIVSGYLLTA